MDWCKLQSSNQRYVYRTAHMATRKKVVSIPRTWLLRCVICLTSYQSSRKKTEGSVWWTESMTFGIIQRHGGDGFIN